MWNASTLKPHWRVAPSGKLLLNTTLVPRRVAASSCLGAWLWQEVAGAWGSWCLCFPVTAAPGEARAHQQPVRGGLCRGLPALAVVSLVTVLPHLWHWRWVPTCPFPPTPQTAPPAPGGLRQPLSRGTELKDSIEPHPNPSGRVLDTLEVLRWWVFRAKQAILKVL